MGKKYYYIFIFLITALFFSSCGDNPQNSGTESGTILLYSRPGLLDSLNGTCSTFLTRNFFLDTIDFTGYTKLRIEMNSSTDGDLSEIEFYGFTDSVFSIMNVSGTSAINNFRGNNSSVSIRKFPVYARMKLFASVCTGQYYYLRVRDIKIFGIK